MGKVRLQLFSSKHSLRRERTRSGVKRVRKGCGMSYATNDNLERWM
jgi:hypothetical protein